MSKIRVNGIDLYYEQEGFGPPLVLISGYRADLSAWGLIRRELAGHFQVFMFDNRGVGRSDSPDLPYTIENMAEDVRGFIEALHLDRPHILGHSMGGAIAQTLAFKYPEIMDKLILANTLIQIREAPAFAMQFFLKMIDQGMSPSQALEGSLPWLFSRGFLRNEREVISFIQRVEDNPHRQSLVGQKRQLEAIMEFNSEGWFTKISVPTLVIEGDEDIICPIDSKRLAEGIPGAELISLEGQAHMPHIEAPDQFREAILSFLTSDAWLQSSGGVPRV